MQASTTLETPVTAAATTTRDEARLRQLIADQMTAICAKDLDGILKHYAEDVVLFDVKPPFRIEGVEPLRQMWEECLPCFPDGFRWETRDFGLTVGGDLAVAHWLWRFTGVKDHPATQGWMRTTANYRRSRDGWQIVHEHVSVPFDPRNGLAVFTLEI